MSILHIMYVEKFTEPYIDFILKNFEYDEHKFIVLGETVDNRIAHKKNVIRYNENFENIVPIIRQLIDCEKLIIHGLFSLYLVLVLNMHTVVLKKSNWVIWGKDLYFYKYKKKNWKTTVYEKLRKRVIKKFAGIISLTKGDYYLAKKWYGAKGKYYKGIYINPVRLQDVSQIEIVEKKDNSSLNILIGNSADLSNNHFELLSDLEKFKDENIRLYVPLSYGDKIYAQQIVKHGKEMFGDKFIPIMNFLKPNEYFSLLAKMDIAVFAHDRQQAIFNIVLLAYLNKKIYIKSNITTWEYFKEELCLNVHDYYEMKNSDYRNISSNLQSSDDSKKVLHLFDEKYAKDIWQIIFES